MAWQELAASQANQEIDVARGGRREGTDVMSVVAALLVGLAVFVWSGPRTGPRRLRRLASRSSLQASFAPASVVAPEHPRQHLGPRRQGLSPWSRWSGAALAGVAAGTLVGGLSGLVVGIVVAVGAGWAVARLAPRDERVRRERLLADLPFAADLLVACLRAGVSPVQALETVAAGLGGPLGDELASVARTLRLGADASVAWARFLDQPDLAPFGRAMSRAWETGAPLADTLSRLADDARLARRVSAEQRARAVGVKAAAPLGLCFLPAFVLVGIVPLVASAVAGLVG